MHLTYRARYFLWLQVDLLAFVPVLVLGKHNVPSLSLSQDSQPPMARLVVLVFL
jgi:hypothetical protein